MADAPMPFELFHELTDASCAQVRRWVTAQGLKPLVSFRNVAFPEAAEDLRARGGSAVPALWDGARLFVGVEAIRARLEPVRGSAPQGT